jgi:diguanylate cyclase (GGDEF)-like protein/PAS domain S-box-containing protein
VKGASPITRISFGLVILTTSLLLIGDVVGLTPGDQAAVLDARKKFCETLAVQFALAAEKDDIELIRTSLELAVQRNDDVISGALRLGDGRLLAQSGDHKQHWQPEGDEKSTPTHTRVPIFRGDKRWGTVEVRFVPMRPAGLAGIAASPLVRLLGFIALAGFVTYLGFMRKTLRHLDPSAVIPGRVQAALDVLAEGVVLVDHREHIVLANSAFVEKTGRPASSLMGKAVSGLKWTLPKSEEPAREFPWLKAIQDGKSHTATELALKSAEGGPRTFMVNAAPILDGAGKPRGSLATFDDVTELEKRTEELQQTLSSLRKSQDEVSAKNKELEFLATRDPLTGCLNRRSFLAKIEIDFEAAQRDGKALSCIMGDIDHFKRVNDTYGHAVGDEVIKRVAEALGSGLRPGDAICRYGGEEFCILLPGIDVEAGASIAERLRTNVALLESLALGITSGDPVTASLGVSSIEFDAAKPADLIEQADQALYVSKHNGRNRVTRWDEVEGS